LGHRFPADRDQAAMAARRLLEERIFRRQQSTGKDNRVMAH
jgi:hypothetical protein